MKAIREISIFAALLLAGSVFVACQKEDDVQTAKAYTLIVKATKGANVATKALAEESGTVKATWEEGDEVSVFSGESLLGTLTAEAAGATTTFSGELNTVPEVGAELSLRFKSADYTEQGGTLDYIAANCDYATASVSVEEVDSEAKTITTSEAAEFESQQAIVKFTLKDSDGNKVNVASLRVNDGETTYTVAPEIYTNVLYVALPSVSNKTITLHATSVGISPFTFDYAKTGVTFENGSFYTRTVTMTKVEALSTATRSSIWRVIGTDGNMYVNTTSASFSSTTPCAIVAYVRADNAEYIDFSSLSYKGLALALTDVEGGPNYDWGSNYSYTCIPASEYLGNDHYKNVNYRKGIDWTLQMANKTGACEGHTHAAASAAYNYGVSRPEGASIWFLPTIGQWNMIAKGLSNAFDRDAITQSNNSSISEYTLRPKFQAIGATSFNQVNGYYQTNSLCNSDKVWIFVVRDGRVFDSAKVNDYNVRAVFAF